MKAFVTKQAPFFKGQSWHNGFKEIQLTDFKNKYLVLFFYPLDFTFVCPTEIIEFSNKAKNFHQLNCNLIGCSVDSHFAHMQYTKLAREKGGLGELAIPLLSDLSHQISKDYGVLLDDGLALRGTFIIDKNQVIRHIGINDLPVGRNVDEVLRLVEAFQYADEHGEVCPASWKPGQKTMVPDYDSSKLDDYWKTVHAKK